MKRGTARRWLPAASCQLAAALLLGITGCAIGPSPRPRPAPAAAALTGSAPAAERPFLDSLASASRLTLAPPALDTAGALRWLGVIRDTQLVALVRTALRNNRDLQAAVARVQEYRALYGVARGELFPRLDANGSFSSNKAAFSSFPPALFDAFRATADVQWELDFWGRVRRSTQAARYDRNGREDDRRAVLLSLVSDVAVAYLELRELDDDLRISEQTLATRQQTYRLAGERFTQGVISELDVRQFEAEVGVASARVAQFTRQRAQKENQLSLLLGQAPGNIGRGGPLAEAVQAVAVPDSVPSTLLVRRPDVLRSQDDFSAALARVGVAEAARLPRVAITATYGRQHPALDGLFGRGSEIYTLQFGASVPLFTGGRAENQQRAAQARAEQARFRFEQTFLGALRETSDALTGVRLGRDELAAQETQVRALRRALELAQRRYESGVSSYLEVLDLQRALFGAELALVQVQRQYLGATVQLYKALGGGWEEDRR
jgi:multidrug efflux system outer membrane protein